MCTEQEGISKRIVVESCSEFIINLKEKIKNYDYTMEELNGFTYIRFSSYKIKISNAFFNSIKQQLCLKN